MWAWILIFGAGAAAHTLPSGCSSESTTYSGYQHNVYPTCNVANSKVFFMCYDPHSSGPIYLTLDNPSIGGYKASEWKGYDWFLAADGRTWGDVFFNTGGWSETSFGWASWAKPWTGRANVTTSNGQVTLTFSGPIPTTCPNKRVISWAKSQEGSQLCNQLYLGVYRGRGYLGGLTAHPTIRVGICPFPNTTNASSGERTEPKLLIPPSNQHSTAIKAKVAGKALSRDEVIKVSTGISGTGNNWLLMAEHAANTTSSSCIVCMGPRPFLRIVPAAVNVSCLVELMTRDNLNSSCSEHDLAFPLVESTTTPPIFSVRVAPGNFTCLNLSRPTRSPSTQSVTYCTEVITLPNITKFVSRADLWWWCGGSRIFDKPLRRHLCALISLIIPAFLFEVREGHWPDPETALQLQDHFLNRINKRETPQYEWLGKGDPTYIDAIGIPRGVPEEYKLADQIAGGFESSLCPWCTINKNVDRINYVHYNVQKLGNWTQEGFESVHEQLKASSLMAFQNRIALDMLLSEKGGVCAIFGDQCCTFIPNNTAPDGRLTRAIDGLRTLNKKMKEHSGVDTTMWDNWMNVFGKYKTLVSSILLSIAVFAALLTLCGCCCIPCLRELSQRLITRAVGPQDPHHMLPLLGGGEAAEVDKEESGVELQCR
uniref:Envelope protein n=1 Tax=Sander lucioperca TaxID=283035 RepID=A0A8C9ZLC5_SANLU